MKKALFAISMIAAISLASCQDTTADLDSSIQTVAHADSTSSMVDSATVAVDSVAIVTDSTTK